MFIVNERFLFLTDVHRSTPTLRPTVVTTQWPPSDRPVTNQLPARDHQGYDMCYFQIYSRTCL